MIFIGVELKKILIPKIFYYFMAMESHRRITTTEVHSDKFHQKYFRVKSNDNLP